MSRSKRKRILFVTRYYYPHIGGVEKHVYKISNLLLETGKYEVVVLAEKHGDTNKELDTVKGAGVLRMRPTSKKIIGLLSIWVFMLKNIGLFIKQDIIHVHDIFIWILPIRLLLFWKPIVLTNHGWEGKYPIPVSNILIKRLSTKLANKSIAVGSYIDSFYGIKSNIVVFGGTSSRIKISKKEKKIVYIGRLSEDTGLDVLLKTLVYFKDYKIIFLGDGVLNNECKKYGKVYGFVMNTNKYTRTAEICFCSGYLTILESLANKSKVVTAYKNKLKKSYYVDTPFVNWIATGDDPARIYKNFKKISNKDIEDGYRWSQNQTWKSLVSTYIEVYNSFN